jgi:hypothetical protein
MAPCVGGIERGALRPPSQAVLCNNTPLVHPLNSAGGQATWGYLVVATSYGLPSRKPAIRNCRTISYLAAGRSGGPRSVRARQLSAAGGRTEGLAPSPIP